MHTSAGQQARGRMNLSIFWISVLGLYLELLLIRWIGTEIRIFAYLQNTVLVVCFLGLGIGLFSARRSISPARGLIALFVLATALAIPASRSALQSISLLLSIRGEMNIWVTGSAVEGAVEIAILAVGLLLTLVIMILVLEPFVPIGRYLGRLMHDHPHAIEAYSFNVAGSLAGIWLFVVLSRLGQPPEVWFAVLLLLGAPAFLRRSRWSGLAVLGATVALVAAGRYDSAAVETVWSPYQKLSLIDLEKAGERYSFPGDYLVEVNNTGYQLLLDLAHDPQPRTTEPPRLGLYDVPALVHPQPHSVLVVGAGTGNDVAGALRAGAGSVTAVDIDPVILEFGRRYHPERPYDSPNVGTVTNDARAFFATSDERFDVISFGLLDSHTTTSLTNARLDHYVYTRESLELAKGLLRPGGILTIAFFPLRPFIIGRLATTLREVFEQPILAFDFPLDEQGQKGILLIAGDLETARQRIASVPELGRLEVLAAERPVELAYETSPARDDWPYLYLEAPMIPALFVLLAALLGFLVLYATLSLNLPRTMNAIRWPRSQWHFFFLGAAFLLLEVQSISKASVVLGNTWLVNAVIISGVLTMVLLANLIVLRRGEVVKLGIVYGVLIAVVVGLYFVDLARLAFLPFAVRAISTGLLTTLPMLFSGIAFAVAFARTRERDIALGANLLGALVGAVLESVSFLLGIKALLLIVGLFYLLAALTRPGTSQAASAPVAAAAESAS